MQWAENGIALESTLPYLGQDGVCNASLTKAAKTSDVVRLLSNDGNAVLTALATVCVDLHYMSSLFKSGCMCHM